MRTIVYLFMALAGASAGIAAYNGLGFTVIEAFFLSALVLLTGAVFVEGVFRRRIETYLTSQVEEMARQIASMAKTVELASDQLAFLSRLNLKERSENIEADVSVLGTVVHQLAEAVAELEDNQLTPGPHADGSDQPATVVEESAQSEPATVSAPVLAVGQVDDALRNNRVEQYMQPIVMLPLRRAIGYELIPRLTAEDGTIYDAAQFMHLDDETETMARLVHLLVDQAANISSQADRAGEPTILFMPTAPSLLFNRDGAGILAAAFDSVPAMAASIILQMPQSVFKSLDSSQNEALDRLVEAGAGICLSVVSLRGSLQQLADRGVKYLKIDARKYIENPLDYTDYHRADVADYVDRFGIGLVMENIESEEQVLELLDDRIPYAQGNHIAPISPVRPDLAGETTASRRAAR